MNTRLCAVNDFLTRMVLDHGILLACVGGAARDTFLGREPKDYDFVFLDTAGKSLSDLADIIAEVTGTFPASLREQEGSAANGAARGLVDVLETHYSDGLRIQFQYLLYEDHIMKSFGLDAAKAVVHHDCSLNHAWLAKVGTRLVPRVTDEFPNPATGNTNYFAAHVNYERKAYIRSKFPEFNHVI